ncbi:unnamed protein product [Dibothriocephalus latus]|uniref:Uncharacterized protein n=1 Tax=Dibothriocephalus latus TaxID=60516 RepID=A0A3P7MA60_DIBLA|nr:unnamed protein product [Dibothriocephalus latus]
MNQPLDSVSYDLKKVGKELLEHSGTYFCELNVFCADHEHSNATKPQDLLNRARMTLSKVEADLKFWDDIVQHAVIPTESLQDIAAAGDKLRKVKSEVEQIIESLKIKKFLNQPIFDTYLHPSLRFYKNSKIPLSRSVGQGSGLLIDALPLDGGDLDLDHQPVQPESIVFSSFPFPTPHENSQQFHKLSLP